MRIFPSHSLEFGTGDVVSISYRYIPPPPPDLNAFKDNNFAQLNNLRKPPTITKNIYKVWMIKDDRLK